MFKSLRSRYLANKLDNRIKIITTLIAVKQNHQCSN